MITPDPEGMTGNKVDPQSPRQLWEQRRPLLIEQVEGWAAEESEKNLFQAN